MALYGFLVVFVPLFAFISTKVAAGPLRSPKIGLAAQDINTAPSVTIKYPEATITGLVPAFTAPRSEEFPGIPFAVPPVGTQRLRPPVPIDAPLGNINATINKGICPQLIATDNIAISWTGILGQLTNSPLFQTAIGMTEDCLFLNVHRPQGTTPSSMLPVLVWFFGGGFELGWNFMYDGSVWVEESIDRNQPIIVVTVNYRVAGFGFLPGKEVLADGAANLGLRDQRLGLQWVADNIADFGGDPAKVTIWGESAGSISVFDHMVAYGGDNTYKGSPLFRGAIMNSGTAIPVDPVNSTKPQMIYDTVVSNSACSSAVDTLNCLRSLSYQDFLNATNSVPALLSYSSVALSYVPRPDYDFMPDSPEQLSLDGRITKIPFIVGDQQDEGTLFALFQDNITTTAQIVDYLAEKYFWSASRELLQDLTSLYIDTPEYQSPFNITQDNNWYPQFSRLAAMLGDLTFTITRRVVLQTAQRVLPGMPFWSYLSNYDQGFPILGTFHGSDILQVFYGIKPNYASKAFHSYYINFINDLDPNGADTSIEFWPKWVDNHELINMYANRSELISDTFRQDVGELLGANIKSFYF